MPITAVYAAGIYLIVSFLLLLISAYHITSPAFISATVFIFPWVGVALLYLYDGLKYTIKSEKEKPHIESGFLVGALVALFFPPYGFELVSPGELVSSSIIFSVCIFALVLYRDLNLLRIMRAKVIVLVLLCGIYGWSTARWLNTSLDTSTPQVYFVPIELKSADMRYHGRLPLVATIFSELKIKRTLVLAPWALSLKTTKIEVPKDFYEKVDTGKTIAVRVYKGALAARWYELQHPR